MDLTPKFAQMDFSEDSGCATASSVEFSSSVFESTPSISQQTSSSCFLASSRKRKAPFTKSGLPIKVIPENQLLNTPFLPKINSDFLSSTLNESRNIELFIHENLTPNFYLERESATENANKEEAIACTPPRPEKYSEYLPKTNSNQKLGSPERNEILYPSLKHFGSAYKPPTYQNLKRYTPAKKRLFGVVRKEKTDPIPFFLNDKNRYVNVVEKIFSYLDDTDLYNVQFVSTKWRNALSTSKIVSKRVGAFIEHRNLNKENLVRRKTLPAISSPISPRRSPPSPSNRNFNNFMKVRENLKEGQSLNKCPICKYPSIIDHQISQCQRSTCGYIYCTFCNSSSIKGPENFIDQCKMSQLVIDKPKKTKIQALLSDSPLKASPDNEIPSFFLSETSLNSSMFNNTSGYITETELTYCKALNTSINNRKSSVLHESNTNLVSTRKSSSRKSYLVPVVSLETPKEDITEPSSPPKVKSVKIGSKASKKNLKRLLSF